MPKTSFYSGTGITSETVNNLEQLKTSSETAAANASTSETNSAASEIASASSASAASASAAQASNDATVSSNARTASETAKVAAEAAEANAETAETAAVAARQAAENAASSSTSSASSASSSASTATTKASEASTSATASEVSKVASVAAQAAAETAATNSASDATTASTSATTATTKAGEASTSATNAATSATTATTQAGIATTKAGEAATSATASASSATASEAAKDAALAALDNFDDRYLGAKASDPTVDNDGNALVSGALYFNTSDDVMKVYTGSAWVAAYASLSGALLVANNLSDLASAASARTNLGLGTAATSAATDFVAVTGDTMTGALDVQSTITADGLTVDGNVGIGTSSNLLSGSNRTTVSINNTGSTAIAFGVSGTREGHIYSDTSALEVSSASNPMRFTAGDAERMRLGSDGTVLVGRTAEGDSNVGHTFRQDGFSQTTRSGGLVADFNRLSSDGDICRYQKDGAIIGKISSVSSSRLKVSSNDVQGYFFLNNGTANASNKLWLNGSLLAWDDSAYDIGSSSTKFKDLYMSGKIQLGGTGAEKVYVEATNPRLYLKGDTNSYYPSIRVDGVHGGISLGTYWGGNISGTNGITFLTGSSATDAGTQRMKIENSTGDLLVGCTSLPSASVKGFGIDNKSTVNMIVTSTNTTSGDSHHRFFNPNGDVGGISTSGSATTYSTSSDHRLKENVVYDWDATTRLKQLKPARFNFIADAETTVDGFIAHEAQAVVPEAVVGTHNEVDADGNAVMQGIDQAKLVPLLVKTIQELEARITALENA